MHIVPQRLLALPFVNKITSKDLACILHKTLKTPLQKRESYLATHVFSIVLQGEQHLTTFDGERKSIKAGQWGFIPRGVYTISDLIPQKKGTFENITCFITDELVNEFLRHFYTLIRKKHWPECTIMTHQASQSINLFAQGLLQVFPHELPQHLPFVHNKLMELLHLLHIEKTTGDFPMFLRSLNRGKPKNIKQLMEQHFDLPLKIDDYAQLSGRTPTAFRRDFKEAFNTTPRRWLRERKLEKAFELLSNLKANVTETALDVGYENISYFIQIFRNKYDIYPQDLIRQERRKRFLD